MSEPQAGLKPQLSLRTVLNLSPEAARKLFETVRWGSLGPVCPRCLTAAAYFLKTRERYKCIQCGHQFTATSATIFASSKLPLSTLLAVVVAFVQAAKGISSLQLCRNLGISQKTAFILLHKLREAISVSLEELQLCGVVEIDGATFGGYSVAQNQATGKYVKRRYVRKHANRHVVVVAHGRLGRTVPFIVKRESEAFDNIVQQVSPDATIAADGGHAWDSLKELFEMVRIHHNVAFSLNNACTNNAESYFSMLRRMHRGVHHKITKEHMRAYASEMAWKLDFRTMPNDEKILTMLMLALNAPPSKWKGYWQRGKELETAA